MINMNKANMNKAAMRKSSIKYTVRPTQQGVVLFFALIALVVMSLAAVALIRSVDTNSLIAGNLAFKRSAAASADSGTEAALSWLDAQSDANIVLLENDNLLKAYYATSIDDPLTPAINESNGKAMVEANGVVATGAGIDAAGMDGNENTITYVIQRMCRGTGEANVGNCLMGPGTPLACTSVSGIPVPPAACNASKSPIYRITARVVGPKNTVSIIQAFMS